jgi:hypothetical protein
MVASTKQLASIQPANKQEQALLVLASCYSFPELVSYEPVSSTSFNSLVQSANLTRLASTILDTFLMLDASTVCIPKFSLTSTSILHIADYLDTCKEELALAETLSAQKQLASLAAKEDHKNKVLARASTMYPVKFATWILEQLPDASTVRITEARQLAGAQQGDHLGNYWKRILTSLIKDPATYWSYDSRYVADLFNEIEDCITSDSVQGLETYKLLDKVRAEASLFGASILGEPSARYKAIQPAKSIPLGTVLGIAHNGDKPASQCISGDVPTEQPCKTSFSSHTQYLIALAKWRAVTGSGTGVCTKTEVSQVSQVALPNGDL